MNNQRSSKDEPLVNEDPRQQLVELWNAAVDLIVQKARPATIGDLRRRVWGVSPETADARRLADLVAALNETYAPANDRSREAAELREPMRECRNLLLGESDTKK